MALHSYSRVIANAYTNTNTYNDTIKRINSNSHISNNNDDSRKHPVPPVGPKPSMKTPRKFKKFLSIDFVTNNKNVGDKSNSLKVNDVSNNDTTKNITITTNNNNNNNNNNEDSQDKYMKSDSFTALFDSNYDDNNDNNNDDKDNNNNNNNDNNSVDDLSEKEVFFIGLMKKRTIGISKKIKKRNKGRNAKWLLSSSIT